MSAEPLPSLRQRLKGWARALKREGAALRAAALDPWGIVRWMALGVLAFALSPVDLIPDVIPGLGQFDDLVGVTLGLWIAL